MNVSVDSEGSGASVDGGNVKELWLDLQSHGFAGEVRIWVVAERGEDELFAPVTADAPLSIELVVGKALYNAKTAPEPLRLGGWVTERRVREVPSEGVAASPIRYREYTLGFCDAPRAMWSQHRPSVVYANTTLAKVIEDNLPTGVKLDLSWPRLAARRPMICLGLGEDEASFYDLLMWLCDREAGHVGYDYDEQRLCLGAAKVDLGRPEDFPLGAISDTRALQVTLAPRPRQAVHLINSRSGATPKWEVPQPNAAHAVRRDYLLHTAIEADAKTRTEIERARVAAGSYDLAIRCEAYPEAYLPPGRLTRVGGEFGDSLLFSEQTLRVFRQRLHARATTQLPEHDIESETTEYFVSLQLDLEPQPDARFRSPPYRAPRYPLLVEGKILSAVGNSGDRAYTVYEDASAGNSYKVGLPCWNATITIPVAPDFVPGHLYFPVYKDSRVLLSLELESARIARFLEWGADVAVPSASQGNQLLLGKNDKSETSIKHWYVDNRPQLVIARTHQGDKGTVSLEEGTLVLELTEEGEGSGFGSTVSVEPQAQMAKAQSSQKAELAQADLEQARDGAAQSLAASSQRAATAVRSQAESLSQAVDQRSSEVRQALDEVSDGVGAQVQSAVDLVAETRGKLDELLD